MPEKTDEVVELYNYLVESRDVTLFNMRRQLGRSIELLLFLFDYEPADERGHPIEYPRHYLAEGDGDRDGIGGHQIEHEEGGTSKRSCA